VSCPHPAPRPRPRRRPCCAHGAGPGMCALAANDGDVVVVRWHTCSDSAARCDVGGILVFIIISVVHLYVAAALAKLVMASTVACRNYDIAAFAMLYLAPMAVFFVRQRLVRWLRSNRTLTKCSRNIE
jgi:hypothetical protein